MFFRSVDDAHDEFKVECFSAFHDWGKTILAEDNLFNRNIVRSGYLLLERTSQNRALARDDN